MQKPGSSLPQRSLRELLFLIVASGVSGIRLSPSLVLLDFREITADLVHRVISRRHTTGGRRVSWLIFKAV
jgi:hypothetical protein